MTISFMIPFILGVLAGVMIVGLFWVRVRERALYEHQRTEEAKDAKIKRLEATIEGVPENERGRAWFGNEGLDCRTGRLVATKCL